MTAEVPYAVNKYVDRCLSKMWEPELSRQMNELFRHKFLGEKDRLVKALRTPFLVSEYLALPGRKKRISSVGTVGGCLSGISFHD